MYVMVTTSSAWRDSELKELSAAELAEAEEINGGSVSYKRVDATKARAWVASGGKHSTPLWVDDAGKVRYAEAMS